MGVKIRTWKYEIGQVIKDSKRDITIIDRKFIEKEGNYYRYTCNICGFDCGEHWSIRSKKYKDELWVKEQNLSSNNQGCSCCANWTVVEGINDIPTTAPWMVKYFQGGYDEAKKYTKTSNQRIYPICSDCGRVKDKKVSISNIYKNHTIGCQCGDGYSYGHKYTFNLFIQLKQEFIDNYTFNWCRFYNPYKRKEVSGEYDFILKNNKLIIEVDGGWHRQDNKMSGQTKEESIYLDNEKDRLANEYGYKMIRISDEGDIKQNILESDLNKLFNLSNIDWNKCYEFACSNRVKEACDLWSTNKYTSNEIGEIMKLDKHTIIKYLIQGDLLNWCNYNSEDEIKKSYKKMKEATSKKVKCIEDNKIFISMSEAGRYYNIIPSSISEVCNGKRKTAGKRKFEFVS